MKQFFVYTKNIKFDWDPAKNLKNKLKHGISFELAITAFDDPNAWIEFDEKHSTTNEVRESLLGESDAEIIVVIFTIRIQGSVCRIISARPANRKERSFYEKNKKF